MQLAIVVGVFVLITAVLRSRSCGTGRTGAEACLRRHREHPLEMGVAVVLAGAAAFLVWFGVQGNEQLGAGAPADLAAPPAARIDVSAYRFGMLPIGIAALVVTWRWIVREERVRAAAKGAGEP